VDEQAEDKHMTALQIASHEGHLDIVEYLLDNKASIELADDDGDTPLLYAAYGYV
jgi:ankyrin repeat protein